MDTQAIIAALDDEIDRLQQAREILTSIPKTTEQKRGPGRPKGTAKPAAPNKRVLSDEARAKIAAAQKKRWAKQGAEK